MDNDIDEAEMKKVLVVEIIIDGRMTNKEGAAALGLSERQVIRLKRNTNPEKEHKNLYTRIGENGHATPYPMK
ncbi:hypothetical protein WJ0W_003377 [Paenibacillus melissococcoides]|uniref:DNA binding HTH domain-containing protein n=1 Tax=Paenibacillus melissococcoides TaxID=2912268 RepID=A0ABN8U9Q1_9BACL|nr:MULTISPECIES: hypothetical protein [Paenibacillus]MEB9895266.1 hypothetical protein [Bacillus cereus]CAH8246141.1 hypothetical protein WJ0W_003377 [Paenibacillus melissococcoides]CAH8713087.1 hypothetical protein WDD9_003453 [Paenibacillus melissococcoides]CAH8713822.1 hypothetical protein HTL2_003756 [Paenibacillus melissococcoides]GIO80283.1 hypothetical protein J6TS7_38930 [Paenibacillus dendritiformis]